MDIAIQLPEDVVRQLEAEWGDVSQHALEALALDAYRSGIITEAEVGRILKLSSRFEIDAFLKKSHAYLDYTESDLERDIAAIQKVLTQ